MKKLLMLAAMIRAGVAFGQDADSTGKTNWTLGGSVDAYYRYDFHNARDSAYTNNLTSFTNSHNSFELGMASLKADYAKGKVSGTIDLGVGRRAEEFSYNDAGARTAIKQAFVSFSPSEHAKFTMGKWATHVGYELVDAYLNRNYSMAYVFSYGPFFHTGIKADFTFNDIGFMVGVANPTDYLTASFSKKFMIGQLSAASKNSKLKGFLNYVGGKYESGVTVSQLDLVAAGEVSDKFSIGYNGTVQRLKKKGSDGASWWGAALYLNYDPLAAFGLTLRAEYFDDKSGVSGLASATGFATRIIATTLSGNIKIDNLTIIPEFRLDNAADTIFYRKPGQPVKSTAALILAATLHF
jgi:hypothetical protein